LINNSIYSEERVEIPLASLSAEALRAVIESFVLREGTDYGAHEVSLEDKVAQVMRQLERGEAHIVFDPSTRSVNIGPDAHGQRRGTPRVR
jgi:uncharacterized protein YheU (UPF0270 family)